MPLLVVELRLKLRVTFAVLFSWSTSSNATTERPPSCCTLELTFSMYIMLPVALSVSA